jgi:hypothetical protein
MPPRKELPGTLRRSPAKAQQTWLKVHESAVRQYGEGERAHRTAMDALKHTFEKVGAHWKRKRRKGASDAQAALRGAASRRSSRETFGGVDFLGRGEEELLALARRFGVRGRSRMKKGARTRAGPRALTRR